MKKMAILVSALVFFAAYANVFAEEKNTKVTVEGTIQGLLATINGAKCPAGDEHICAGIEQTFVIATDKGDWYLLPTFTSQQLSPNINVKVRVEGTLTAEGKAINVETADRFDDGKWKRVYSPEIVKEMKQREAGWKTPVYVRKPSDISKEK